MLARIRSIIEDHCLLKPNYTLVTAVSGGPDSLCLLHVLHTLSDELSIRLHVAHLDHGIRGAASEADAAFVVKIARDWGLPFTVEKRDVPTYASGRFITLEEAAREVRYTFLAEVAQNVGAWNVAVAHQLNDQIETILMNLLRGTGPRGLRGMQPKSFWPYPVISGASTNLQLIRPLLYISRADIEDYCDQHGLKPRLDHTNLDTTYLRNRIRHELIPILESYNPAVCDSILRLCEIISDDYGYLNKQVLEAWEKYVIESDEIIAFSLVDWEQLHLSLKRGLLREAIRRHLGNLQDIEARHIEIGLKLIQEKPSGSQVHLPNGLLLYKDYERFTIGKKLPLPDVPQLTVDHLLLNVPGITYLPESNWYVYAEMFLASKFDLDELRASGPWIAHVDPEKIGNDLLLRPRKNGDRFQPLGMVGHSKLLADFMVDAKIPVGIRNFLPIVVAAGRIVWIPGWRLDERVKFTKNSQYILKLAFLREE